MSSLVTWAFRGAVARPWSSSTSGRCFVLWLQTCGCRGSSERNVPRRCPAAETRQRAGAAWPVRGLSASRRPSSRWPLYGWTRWPVGALGRSSQARPFASFSCVQHLVRPPTVHPRYAVATAASCHGGLRFGGRCARPRKPIPICKYTHGPSEFKQKINLWAEILVWCDRHRRRTGGREHKRCFSSRLGDTPAPRRMAARRVRATIRRRQRHAESKMPLKLSENRASASRSLAMICSAVRRFRLIESLVSRQRRGRSRAKDSHNAWIRFRGAEQWECAVCLPDRVAKRVYRRGISLATTLRGLFRTILGHPIRKAGR